MTASTIKSKGAKLKRPLIIIFWITVWQLVYLYIGRDLYVPSPINVFKTLSNLALQASFWGSIASSLYRVIAGVVLSLVIGVILGILAAIKGYIYDLLQPLIIIIKSTPVMSFIIIALIWIKSSSTVPIFIVFLMCFPIIWTNVVAGIHNVDEKLLQMARGYGVGGLKVLKGIYLPSIAPYIYAAFITSLGLGWKVGVAAEVLSHPRKSIGTQLYSAKVYLETNEQFAWTVVIIVLSILLEAIITYGLRKYSKGYPLKGSPK